MTIRFTTARDGFAAGSVVTTLTPAKEAAYVAAGVAAYAAATLQSPTGAIAAAARVLGTASVPAIIVPNGTVATAGTITLGTALPLIYPQAWIYLPAGAVVGGAAGFYYCEFSSTTVGVVRTNYQATMTLPYIPTGLTTAVGSNSAYTQTVSTYITMGAINVRGGLMGSSGGLRYEALYSYNNSAGAKVPRLDFGGSQFLVLSATTTVAATISKILRNRAVNSQIIQGTATSGAASSTGPSLLAIDTSVDVVASYAGQIAVATDYLILESWSIELMPAP